MSSLSTDNVPAAQSNNIVKNIFLMPCWGGRVKENFDKTVQSPVKQAKIFRVVSKKTRAKLTAIFGDNDMAVWGSMDGTNNRVLFDKMRPDDYILFADNREVKLVGQIALKTINPNLSKILWPDDFKRVFSLIYFIDKIVKVNAPLAKVFAAFGYRKGYVMRGLTSVAEERLKKFYTNYPDIVSLVTDTKS